MHTPPYTAVDAVVSVTEKSTEKPISTCDSRATVIDLLSHCNQNQQALKKHETDQIFILGYN
ncbi:hypothetical protein CWC16_18240 [Pseudoalteromonas sp. S3776]|uniref:hypothetical protein n=1 Tax=unclassified Pseudoalteromonas TaxID=194690 RepID=UPI001109076E|nr:MULTISPECIES: hypothetical protein [unclassified Pseudoalteromonas]TMO70354.1 hypothetical protein CWC17_18515 [Pseudoalteromonas sp. S3785]TMO76376.1 hypothetical protein CWC16_18240 [Pseudoalteromonas sp. S3776]